MNTAKHPLLERARRVPVRLLWVLGKKPRGVESPLRRVPCNLTRTDGDKGRRVEDKGPPGVAGGSCSPIRNGGNVTSTRYLAPGVAMR